MGAMSFSPDNPIFGAAVLKLSFILTRMADEPGFRFVYFGTLKRLDVTDTEVNAFIDEHRDALTDYIKTNGS